MVASPVKSVCLMLLVAILANCADEKDIKTKSSANAIPKAVKSDPEDIDSVPDTDVSLLPPISQDVLRGEMAELHDLAKNDDYAGSIPSVMLHLASANADEQANVDKLVVLNQYDTGIAKVLRASLRELSAVLYDERQAPKMQLATLKDDEICSAAKVYSGSISGNGDTLTLEVKADMSACLLGFSSLIFENVDEISMIVDMNYFHQCDGADYSGYNKLSFSDLLAQETGSLDIDPSKLNGCPEGATKGRKFSAVGTAVMRGKTRATDAETKLEFMGIPVPSGETISVEIKTLLTTMGQNDEPCLHITDEGKTRIESCWDVSRRHVVGSVGSQIIDETVLRKVDLSAVLGRIDEPYLTGGAAQVAINNWSGTVSFDGSASPSWTMSDGTETVQGKLD